MVKTVRSGNLRQLLISNKIQIPPLDVNTRWNSTYKMLKTIHRNKEFFISLEEGSLITEELWNFIEQFVAAFYHVYVCTLEFQAANYSIGDFICSWMKMKLNLSKVNNEMAKSITAKMEIRQKKLLDNDVVRAALYIDQRFNFAGSNSKYLSIDDKKIAEVHI